MSNEPEKTDVEARPADPFEEAQLLDEGVEVDPDLADRMGARVLTPLEEVEAHEG